MTNILHFVYTANYLQVNTLFSRTDFGTLANRTGYSRIDFTHDETDIKRPLYMHRKLTYILDMATKIKINIPMMTQMIPMTEFHTDVLGTEANDTIATLARVRFMVEQEEDTLVDTTKENLAKFSKLWGTETKRLHFLWKKTVDMVLEYFCRNDPVKYERMKASAKRLLNDITTIPKAVSEAMAKKTDDDTKTGDTKTCI